MDGEARDSARGAGPYGPSPATLKRLYAKSGNLCAFPDCGTTIVDGGAHVGDVCHIRAAGRLGPRFDPAQTAGERHGEANLVLLCANHHRVIDGDARRFTVAVLENMKADHEASVHRLPESEAEAGVQLLFSINQSGGVAAHHIENLNIVMQPPDVPRGLPVAAGMTFVGMDDVLGEMGSNGNERYIFDTQKFIYLRLVPRSGTAPMGLPDLLEHFKNVRILPMTHDWSGTAARNRCGAMYYVLRRPREIIGFTQGFTSGELWGMNSAVFQAQAVPAQPGEPERRISIIPSVAMEKLYVETLNNYVQVANKLFAVPPPYRIELGVKGIRGAYVSFPRPPAGFLQGPVFEDAFRRTITLQEPTAEAMEMLLREYFDAFYSELVGYKRKDVMTQNFISAHALPREP